jgi:hypothetical protein
MRVKAGVNIKFELTRDSWCPRCNAPEVDPEEDRLFIRGYKVYDDKGAWSQCLVCAGYYSEVIGRPGQLEFSEEDGDSSKGWFVE